MMSVPQKVKKLSSYQEIKDTIDFLRGTNAESLAENSTFSYYAFAYLRSH
tara:strand:- start:16434 stop:16583 length:150 start_codon:yes stop_codon:yes gene_type:complete